MKMAFKVSLESWASLHYREKSNKSVSGTVKKPPAPWKSLQRSIWHWKSLQWSLRHHENRFNQWVSSTMKIASNKSPAQWEVSPGSLASLQHQENSYKSVSGTVKKSPAPWESLQRSIRNHKIASMEFQTPWELLQSMGLRHRENGCNEVSRTLKMTPKKSLTWWKLLLEVSQHS